MNPDLLNRFKDRKILVVGDYCIDKYYYGEPKGISPEAPVIRNVGDKDSVIINPGMAGNIVAGINALGAKCYAVGIVGDEDDEASRILLKLFNKMGVNTEGMISQKNRTTPEFIRIVSGGEKYPSQQRVRHDVENTVPISDSLIEQIYYFVHNKLVNEGNFDAIIVADYNEFGKGIINPPLLDRIKKICNDKRIISVGDSRQNFQNFYGFTCIKPNIYEARQLCNGNEISSSDELAKQIIQDLNLKTILITKDKEGMYLATNSGVKKDFPSYAEKVVDVTGAGDSVTSAFTLALASGFSYEDSAQLANYAAAIAVSKPGVSTVLLEELKQFVLEKEKSGDKSATSNKSKETKKEKTSDKLRTLEQLKEIISKHKQEGKKIGTTNGSFDLLHIGHIYMLESAKALTDILVVLINSDASIKKLKGPKRPIVPERERAEMLSSLECIDYVMMFDGDNPLSYIQELKPDIHIKGGTFEQDRIKAERDLIESWGGRHITLPIVEGYSTTNLINRIVETYDNNSQ
jgi:D-beta-D-heptose 7-phosphate kinase/D-beta-D-heptose 1-phosphate adenosyltransferase